MKYLPSLDLLKLIMAILIVAAHCEMFIEWATIYDAFAHITEMAVPTFFCISAYLFFKKIIDKPENEKQIFSQTIKRLIIFFGVWYILMLPYSLTHFFQNANIKEIIYVIPFNCAFWGYWFIKALIFNTTIVYFIRGRKSLIIGGIIASIIYLFFGFDYIHGHLGEILHPYYTFYYHTYSFVFGALIARYQEQIPSILMNKKNLLISLFLTLILSSIPDFRVIAKLLYPVILLLIALNWSLNIEPKLSKRIRIFSILFYVMQFIFIFMYNGIVENSHSFIRFTVVMFIITSLSFIITELEGKKGLNYLKYLH